MGLANGFQAFIAYNFDYYGLLITIQCLRKLQYCKKSEYWNPIVSANGCPACIHTCSQKVKWKEKGVVEKAGQLICDCHQL